MFSFIYVAFMSPRRHSNPHWKFSQEAKVMGQAEHCQFCLSICKCVMTQFRSLSASGWELQFANLMSLHFVASRWVSSDTMACLARQAKGEPFSIICTITLFTAPWNQQKCLLAWNHRGRFQVWDATCVDTFYQSYRQLCAGEAGAAAAFAEEEKVKKYSHLDQRYFF